MNKMYWWNFKVNCKILFFKKRRMFSLKKKLQKINSKFITNNEEKKMKMNF